MGAALLTTAIGAIILYIGYKVFDDRKKYEFENRTNGGVVKFKDWKATKKHGLTKGIGNLLITIGLILVIIGGLMLMVSFI